MMMHTAILHTLKNVECLERLFFKINVLELTHLKCIEFDQHGVAHIMSRLTFYIVVSVSSIRWKCKCIRTDFYILSRK